MSLSYYLSMSLPWCLLLDLLLGLKKTEWAEFFEELGLVFASPVLATLFLT